MSGAGQGPAGWPMLRAGRAEGLRPESLAGGLGSSWAGWGLAGCFLPRLEFPNFFQPSISHFSFCRFLRQGDLV